MTGNGTVVARIPAGRASDAAGNISSASTSTDNSVTYDITAPSVTINQAARQADPTNRSPINFTVVFSESVANFTTGDVVIDGTAPGVMVGTVTGSGRTYNVAVTGMTGNGTVLARIPAGRASDAAGNISSASTSTDNSVTYDITVPRVTINQAVGQDDPTNLSPINFTVVFSESVANFTTGDVTISGTALGVKVGTVTGSDRTYNVAVTGMTGNGTVIATIAAGRASDAAGNLNLASTSTDNTVTYDITAPRVTINQAARQADPTNRSPIHFTVIFDEPVTNFTTGDVTISGTAPGVMVGTVTGNGTNYNVAVTGMSGNGTVIATIAAGLASDAAGNLNLASTSTDNTVLYDITAPSVTINQAIGQADPTNLSPINFTVVFSESVANFVTGDVVIDGTAPGDIVGTVTGSGGTYNVEVSGMTGNGTVIARIPAGRASDAAGNISSASTSTDNSVTYDITVPRVTINQAVGQDDPTNLSPINFTVVFSESVANFTTGDVTISGTAPGLKVGTVTGSGRTYNVAVTGMSGNGTVIASIAAGRASDAAGNGNTPSTSTDNTVTYDISPPIVTSTLPEDGETGVPVNSLVAATFSQIMQPLTTATFFVQQGLTPVSGTISTVGNTATFTPDSDFDFNTVYTATITTGALNLLGNALASDYVWSFTTGSAPDTTSPTVTINQAALQDDPTNNAPINFTVVFSEWVGNFTTGDVTISGTAPGIKVGTVTGSGKTYNVAVSGMTGNGSVIATIAGGRATDASGNPNLASTSTDNLVRYDVIEPRVSINQAAGQDDPTNLSPINFTVVFSESVANFTTGDVTISGTAPGVKVGTVTGSGTTYNVAVNGMTGSGTVVATIADERATDAAGNFNLASTSTDNRVLYDISPPTVTINQAVGQADPTNLSPINFTVIFNEPVTNFTTGDVTISGTAPGVKVGTITGNGTTYNVAVSGMSGNGTVVASIAAGKANDAAGNGNVASTSTDNSVRYDIVAPTVTSTDPLDGETGVPLNSDVSATFSENMRNLTTDTFTLRQGLTPVAGTVVTIGNTATFTPGSVLDNNTVYTATITTGARDSAGNALASDYVWTFLTGKPPIDLGAAAPFAGFGGNAGMTNQGILTIINGDIGTTGVSTMMTGFHDSTGDGYTETPLNIGDVRGRIYTDAPPPVIFAPGGPYGGTAVTKAIADEAAADALDAYNYLAGLPGGAYAGAGELGGLTLPAGTYTAATSYMITNGDLTLTGNANDIWVFQMGSSLTVGTPGFPRNVILAGGAKAENVFWQVGSAARIEDNCNMVGTIIAQAGVTISTAGQLGLTTLEGRAISLNASVTVVNTHINVP